MNRRDAINQIKQFGGRLDRFRKSGGAPGDGGRNMRKPRQSRIRVKPMSLTSRYVMRFRARYRT